QVVLSAREIVKRGANEKGWAATYQEYHVHLAAQIGETLENAPTVIVQNATPATTASGPSDRELTLREREIAAQEEANRLKRLELGLGVSEPEAVSGGQKILSGTGEIVGVFDPNAAFEQPEESEVTFADAAFETEKAKESEPEITETVGPKTGK